MSEKEIALKRLQPPTEFDHALNYLSLKKSYRTTQAQYCKFAKISLPTLRKYLSAHKEEALKYLEQEGEQYEPS